MTRRGFLSVLGLAPAAAASGASPISSATASAAVSGDLDAHAIDAHAIKSMNEEIIQRRVHELAVRAFALSGVPAKHTGARYEVFRAEAERCVRAGNAEFPHVLAGNVEYAEKKAGGLFEEAIKDVSPFVSQLVDVESKGRASADVVIGQALSFVEAPAEGIEQFAEVSDVDQPLFSERPTNLDDHGDLGKADGLEHVTGGFFLGHGGPSSRVAVGSRQNRNLPDERAAMARRGLS